MIDPSTAVTAADDPVRFPSFASLRASHGELLQRQHEQGDTPETIAAIGEFLRRGQASGALLDGADDRRAAQSLLNYWTTVLYRVGVEPPDGTLAEFDPALAPELPDSLCPYLGLDAFRESNQDVFFGRGRLVAELVDKLKGHRLLAVWGASGSGKSSVVRAGLIPALEQGGLAGSEAWFYFPPMFPGSKPLHNLARLVDPGQIDKTAEALRADGALLVALVGERFHGPVVLVVDQFEEVFTLCQDDATRQAFADQLLGLVGAGHAVILTMRIDFEPQVARLPALQARFEDTVVHLTPMGAKELREAIEEPAKKVGLKFEEGLVDALVHDVLGEVAALPLLQFTLLKLWERRERNRVTWEAYRKLGGGRQALARAADEFFDQLIPEEQVTARRILLKLVRPGEGLEVTSNRVRRIDLYTKAEASDRIDRVLEKFLQARLLRLTQGETPADDQVEVAHEALVRNWPRLVGWLEDERVAMRLRLRLTVAAEQWLRLDKHPSALRRGVLLEESLQFDDLSPLEEEFVNASRAAEEAEKRAVEVARQRELEQARALAEEQARNAVRQRRRAFLFAGLSLFALAMALVAVVAGNRALTQASANSTLSAQQAEIELTLAAEKVSQSSTAQAALEAGLKAGRDAAERQARRARSGQLASAAAVALESDPQLSLLLGVEALNVTRQQNEPGVPAAERAVRQALSSIPTSTRLEGHTGSITALAISDSGRWLVTGGVDNSARLWDLTGDSATQSAPMILSGHTGAISTIAISPDEHWVVTASWDTTVRLWDLTADDPSASSVVLSRNVGLTTALAFTPNNRWLVTGDGDGRVFLWNLKLDNPGSSPVELRGHLSFIEGLAVSADSNLLATAADDGTVRLWDLTADNPSASPSILLGQQFGAALAVAISPDSRWLVAGWADGSVWLWDLSSVDTAAAPFVFREHSGGVANVAISPDGAWFATAGNYNYATGQFDSDIRLWNLSEAASIPVFYRPARLPMGSGQVTGLGFINQWLAAGTDTGLVGVWDVTTDPATTRVILQGHTGGVTAIVPLSSVQQPLLATAGLDGTARLWYLSTSIDPVVLAGHTSTISFRSLAISPDSHWLATGGDEGAVRLWDMTAPDPAVTSVLLPQDSPVSVVAISPESRTLAAGSDGGKIWVWDLTAKDPLAKPLVLPGHIDAIADLVFSPDGRWLVSSSGSLLGGGSDYTVRIWDLAAADPSAAAIVLGGNTGPVLALAVSRDGRWLFTGGTRQGLVWDLQAITASPDVQAKYSFVMQKHSDAIFAAEFSPDGHWLITGDKSGQVFLWDMTAADPAGSPIRLEGHTAWINAIAISPDSHWAATGSDDYTARLWDLTAADPSQSVLTLSGHSYNVNEVAFSPDNHWLVTAGADLTARLWDLTADDPAADSVALVGHHDQVTDAEFSSDGRWLATSSWDTTARLWTMSTDRLIEMACAATGRNLSQTEWDQYFGGESRQEYRKTCEEWPIHPSVVDGLLVRADAEARAGSLDQAIDLYRQALAIDPTRDIDPETRAHQVAAQAQLDLARGAAGRGDIEEAILRFQQAMALDPTLDIDAEEQALQYGAYALRDRADALATAGETVAARAVFELAVQGALLNEDYYLAGSLCHDGSLDGMAEVVLPACDYAVELGVENTPVYDARGLARALTGNINGAIQDYERVVADMKQGLFVPFNAERILAERESILNALKAGTDPAKIFDKNMLDKIREELPDMYALG